MTHPTSQVKYAIKKLRRAGFKRSDFSVRVERHYIPKDCGGDGRQYEYGVARITLYNANYIGKVLAKMLKLGLHVEIIWHGEKIGLHPIVKDTHDDIGKLTFTNINKSYNLKSYHSEKANCVNIKSVEIKLIEGIYK